MSLAVVHITKKQLGLTDAEYQQLLFDAGVRSSKELNEDGQRSLVAAMHSFRRRQAGTRPKSPQERKIWALWFELKGHLPLREQTHDYLLGFCRRAGNAPSIQAIADLSCSEAYKVIEALKRRLPQEQTNLSGDVPF